ncbi:MAG: hypothetical protein HYT87_07200 [Nitrospirae bacterium]|nr:hypothetical protein [Nitrospirota bacterium]
MNHRRGRPRKIPRTPENLPALWDELGRHMDKDRFTQAVKTARSILTVTAWAVLEGKADAEQIKPLITFVGHLEMQEKLEAELD